MGYTAAVIKSVISKCPWQLEKALDLAEHEEALPRLRLHAGQGMRLRRSPGGGDGEKHCVPTPHTDDGGYGHLDAHCPACRAPVPIGRGAGGDVGDG